MNAASHEEDEDKEIDIHPLKTKKLFSGFPKDKSFPLLTEINNKKNRIRNMIVEDLGMPRIFRSNRKPSALVRLERGIKNVFFKKDGAVIKKFPKIRQALITEDKDKKKDLLQDKINIGSLTYYYLKGDDANNKQQANLNAFKLRLFEKSNYFSISKLNDPIQQLNDVSVTSKKKKCKNIRIIKSLSKQYSSKFQTKPDRQMAHSRNQRSSDNIKSATNKMNTSTNFNFTNETPFFIPYSPSSQFINNYIKASSSKLSTNSKRNIKSFTEGNPHTTNASNISLFHSPSHNSANKMTMYSQILRKAKDLNLSQQKMEKTLIKIIDKSQSKLNKKLDDKIAMVRDFEEILGAKTKKDKQIGSSKELYSHTVNITNDVTLMDSRKARLLRMSDSIINLNDEVALTFANRVIENYYKETNKHSNDFLLETSEVIQNKKKEKMIKLRQKVNDNSFMLKKLGYNVELKKQSLMNSYEKLNI